MKKQPLLYVSVKKLTFLGALLLTHVAHAQWSISFNFPIATQQQYSTHSSTTVYGAPGSQIISTRQVPQTVCRSAWVGATTQQCTTQYVTVDDSYLVPAPVYIAPAPIYYSPPVHVAPAPAFGYPGYNHNNGIDHRNRYKNHGYRHNNNQPSLSPTTIYNGNSSGYGIGSYNSPNTGGIRFNSQ